MPRLPTTAPRSRYRADLLVLKHGKPVVLVEAKGLPVPPNLRRAVDAQLRDLARLSGSHWIVLIDPDALQVFSAARLDTPLATIPTEQILQWAALKLPRTVGESTLQLAVERWLANETSLAQAGHQFPELSPFLTMVRQADEILMDVPL